MNIDQDWVQADWLRSMTWDAWELVDGNMVLVDSLGLLLKFLGVSDKDVEKQKDEIRRFVGLPAYEPAPEKLKKEVEGFLGG